MNDFWNERFSRPGFIYGTEPNDFFKQEIQKLTPGKLLLPAEGEGRNAVFAAGRGWDVTAFDPSDAGISKAMRLAAEKGVAIHYLLADFDSIELPEKSFDVLALIYAHTYNWKKVYADLIRLLKPGGIIIIEVFNKSQIKNTSGGPKDPDMLPTAPLLEKALAGLSSLKVWEEQVILSEGENHQGLADVVRCVAQK